MKPSLKRRELENDAAEYLVGLSMCPFCERKSKPKHCGGYSPKKMRLGNAVCRRFSLR